MTHMAPEKARLMARTLRLSDKAGLTREDTLRALETIAAMRTEYCVQHQAIPGGQWHQVTQWDEDPNPYNDGYGPSDDERIITRHVLDLDQSS